MKQKNIIKITLAFFLILLPLCVFLFGVGCEKDEINSNAEGIIGTWQLIPFPETCVGFGDIMIEITSDSVFKKYIDDELNFTSVFSIKTGTLGYDTIFFIILTPNTNMKKLHC